MNLSHSRLIAFAGLVFAAVVTQPGCNWPPEWLGKARVESEGAAADKKQEIPAPINLLLPRKIRIHPFTGTRTFDEAGGIKGVDVRIEARDAYGDPIKAFGDFRFELHSYRPHSPDPKGSQIASWKIPLIQPKKNLLHWDGIAKRYQFKLQWHQPIPVGYRFVLVATFSSPFTERMSDQYIFISGQ